MLNNSFQNVAVILVPIGDDGQVLALGYEYVVPPPPPPGGTGMVHSPSSYSPPYYQLGSVRVLSPYSSPVVVATDIWDNAGTIEGFEIAMTTFLHVLPTGAMIDNAQQGNVGEAVISGVGDVGTLLGVGLVVKGAKGLKIASTAAKAAIVIDVGVAGVRGTQAGINIYHGETGAALANGGEALMRILGITPAAMKLMKNQAADPGASARALRALARVDEYGENWSPESLAKAIEQHAGPNATKWVSKGGKVIVENPATMRQVVIDPDGRYFTIYDPTTFVNQKIPYLTIDGRIPTVTYRTPNGIKSTPMKGHNLFPGMYEERTHFQIIDLDTLETIINQFPK